MTSRSFTSLPGVDSDLWVGHIYVGRGRMLIRIRTCNGNGCVDDCTVVDMLLCNLATNPQVDAYVDHHKQTSDP